MNTERERPSQLGTESGERKNWEICPPTVSSCKLVQAPATPRINNASDGFLFSLTFFFPQI